MPTLPSTTDDAIFDNLGANDLLRYARVCRDAKNAVSSYIRRTFKLERLLGRYFSESQILEFRRLQFRTNALISGSTALQFFDRTFYPDSDLDIYVQCENRRDIAVWLDSVGYKLQPTRWHAQTGTLEEALDKMVFPWDSQEDGVDGSTYSYAPGFVALDFLKDGFESKIQLLLSQSSPITSILTFHSTCVMNFITYEKAYSLYPTATFGDRQSLVTNLDSSRLADYDRAYEKYTERGWKILRIPPKKMIESPRSAFSPVPRQIGDSKCWTMPIFPKLDLPPTDIIEGNTWALHYNVFTAQTSFTILIFSPLGWEYTVAPEIMDKIDHFLDEVPPMALTESCFLKLVDLFMSLQRGTKLRDSELEGLLSRLSV